MAASLNKATIIGMLGKDPEIKTFQNGNRVANLSVATSEKWKDKASGEKKEKTEWHKVNVFNEHLIKICENYLKKGALVYIEGQIETRKYEKDGREIYTTEIVLKPYNGEIKVLSDTRTEEKKEEPKSSSTRDDDDEIPF